MASYESREMNSGRPPFTTCWGVWKVGIPDAVAGERSEFLRGGFATKAEADAWGPAKEAERASSERGAGLKG